MDLQIFTDGASRGNPGKGGFGVIILDQTKTQKVVIERGGREDETTNNRMELAAVIDGLSYVPENSSNFSTTVFTDSAYVVNGVSKWLFGWKKNGWQTKTKTEVKNIDLWKQLSDLLLERKVIWKRIPGHSGIPANERADVIATTFADKKPINLFQGNFEEYVRMYGAEFFDGNVSAISIDGSRKNKKSSSSAVAYSYVSSIGGKVEVHKTWKECESRVKGVSGAKFKKALSAEEEKNLIRDLGNF